MLIWQLNDCLFVKPSRASGGRRAAGVVHVIPAQWQCLQQAEGGCNPPSQHRRRAAVYRQIEG